MKPLFFLFLLFFSCSLQAKFTFFSSEAGSERVIEVKKDGSPFILVKLDNERDEKEALIMLEKIFSLYRKNFVPSSSKEIKYSSPYVLFFEIASSYYNELKNLALKYGIIECDWFMFRNRFLKKDNESKKIFRIDELDNFAIKHSLSEREKSELYKFSVNFLLSETIFVSIQELFERQYRYFSINELEMPFSRLVIIPEVKEFAEFMIEKFGRRRVIDFARTEYSKENWKRFFGEAVNDIEEEFSKRIENYKFSSFFYTEDGEKLKQLFSLYNKNSKTILFKK
ncbi:MAG: hypothetical protein ACP5QT_04170 [Brevinematia bacterium]